MSTPNVDKIPHGAGGKLLYNEPAKGVPYFTPIQVPQAGTAWDEQPSNTLFAPLKIRGMTLPNRIIVSPMCQYSADNGYLTAWHKTHLGSFAARGAGLVLTEVYAISPEGRISPEDVGIWEDGQMAGMKELVDFVHSQGCRIGVQMGHAGRKASTVAPWVDRKAVAVKDANGWPENIISCTTLPYSEDTYIPREMTLEDIETFKKTWAKAVKRALEVGFDTIEFHAAHGYLLNCFLSPTANTRNDEYGGSFENRVRLLLELVDITREIVPSDYPLFARIPGTDYLEHLGPDVECWTIADGAKLGKLLVERGVDFLDVSGGGTDARQKIIAGPGYQVPWADAIRQAIAGTGAYVGTVGGVTDGKQAQEIVTSGKADAVLVGKAFLKDPNLVWHWAEELDIDIHVPSQYGWPFAMTRTHRAKKL